jgi:GNAT superfamily N-acetyltransferase
MAKEIGSIIRDFQRGDLAALKSLVHKTITTCYPGHYCPEAVRFFVNYHEEEAILRDAEAGCTIVLDQGGRLLGTGTLLEDEIKRVFVAPALQQQGLGRRILQHLEELAALQGARIVKLDASVPSKAFYDRLGYVTTEAASLPVENGRRLDFFRMQKTL